MKIYFKKLLSLGLLIALPSLAFSQIKPSIPFLDSELTEPVAITLVSIVFLLILMIAVLGQVLKATIQTFRSKIIKGPLMMNQLRNGSIILALALLLIPIALYSQSLESNVEVAMVGGISKMSFLILVGIISLEIIIIFMMLMFFKHLAQLRRPTAEMIEKIEVRKERQKLTWLERINNTKSLDAASEEAISLSHDYDGIGELDNPTPPWWNWMFIISVVVGIVYVWVLHVSKSVPLQIERLEIANERAEEAIQEYLASAGDLIDETNVTYLENSNDLSAGKQIFIQVCAACHGQEGGGGVGPNLVDDYWLHGGSIKDVFSMIKYGIPEKGMPSWQTQYSAHEIAQLASYIKSIGGNEVANPKEPEGELYVPTEEGKEESESVQEENIEQVAFNF